MMARILLVDDDPLVGTTLAPLLADRGYQVVLAADGRQALGQLRRQPIDVVVTDILMPEVDGLEVIRAVLRDYPGVAVIAMSGGSARLPGADALQLARTLGAHAILPKPLSAKDLDEAIVSVLPR
jgi:two-component system, chemotaxis family, chemotaxis protein CheY